MAKPEAILWLTNDIATPFSKTTEFLASACQRLGIPAIVRDSTDARMLKMLLDELADAAKLKDAANEIGQKYDQLIFDFGIDAVFSLDLNWLIVADSFLDNPQIKRISSIWFDDFRSWCTGGINPFFSSPTKSFQEVIKHFKVLHYFYGKSLAQEAKLLGFTNQKISSLAAPREFLALDYPCTETKKAVFVGNPGFRGKPTPLAIEQMNQGAELEELRRISRKQILQFPEKKLRYWVAREPTVAKFLELATEVKVRMPYESTLQILAMAGTHYPRAFHFLNEIKAILDIAFCVKLVNRYERPAVIHRLYKHGLIDVYSNEAEWEPYEIKSKPYLNFRELPRYYQMYSCHVNAANCLRDATANEKLFEIAACGRPSINIHSPDVAACYNEKEIGLVKSLAELEQVTRDLLEKPEIALEMGDRAKERTEKEHLWDHRLEAIFNEE